MKYIKTVVVFDGQGEYENEEVLNHQELKNIMQQGTHYTIFLLTK